jgi:hypothetical protein
MKFHHRKLTEMERLSILMAIVAVITAWAVGRAIG